MTNKEAKDIFILIRAGLNAGPGSHQLNINNLGDACSLAIEALEEKIEQKNDKWISVNDKLPEDLPENAGRKTISCLVLVASRYKNGKGTVQKRQRQLVHSSDKSSSWGWSRLGSQHITHWKPLPKAIQKNN